MAGPCSVESEDQITVIAKSVRKSGAKILRGGAFKPRTSPYSFQGLGKIGLQFLAEARQATGMPIITEVMDTKDLELVCEYADCLQMGARNMQNFSLLREVGRTNLPVMLKRGMSATIKDLLMSAEYILSEGNFNVLLCERGIRTFENMTRNTLDLNAVPVLKAETHLPVVVDPTHGIGVREFVPAMALAAVAAGADSIMIEVHNAPEQAKSDGEQALLPADFEDLVARVEVWRLLSDANFEESLKRLLTAFCFVLLARCEHRGSADGERCFGTGEQCFQSRPDSKKPRKQVDAAASADSKKPEIPNLRGAIFTRQKRYDEAAEQFKQALASGSKVLPRQTQPG